MNVSLYSHCPRQPAFHLLAFLGAGVRLFLFIVPFTCAIDCTAISNRTAYYFADVTHVIKDENWIKHKKKIVLSSIIVRNLSFSSHAAENFSDNLRFHLINQGFQVEKHQPPPRKRIDEVTALTVDEDVLIAAPQEIQDILERNNSELFLNGYIFETETGSFLEEETSIGIMLFIYNDRGEFMGHLRYIGEDSLASFAESALTARILARKLSELVYPDKAGCLYAFKP